MYIPAPTIVEILPNQRSSCHGAKVKYTAGLHNGLAAVALTCMRCSEGCLALDGTPDGVGSILEAIANTWLPEAVDQWLDKHGADKVYETLTDSEPGLPEVDWIIEQALNTYPAAFSEDESQALWEHVAPSLIKKIEDEIHDIAEDEAAAIRDGGRDSLRYNGLSQRMFL